MLASDPTTVLISLVSIFDIQSGEILLFLLSIYVLMIFILFLINLLPFEKANRVVLHILCIIVLCSSFITFSFFCLIHWFSLYSWVYVRGPIRLRLEVYYAKRNGYFKIECHIEFGASSPGKKAVGFLQRNSI